MFLKPKCPIDAEEWEWLLAGFKWLEREFPELHQRRQLALPTRNFFPPIEATGVARGEELIRQVQLIAGIADWPVRLVAVEGRSHAPVNNVAALQHGRGAAGTFRLLRTSEGVPFAEIHYVLDQLNNPAGLVATFAHELSHYLLHMRSAPFPGGDEIEELFTDFTAVWLGFGIFLGNSARFSQRTDEGGAGGWHTSGWRGYLGERMLMTALALNEMLAGRDIATAAPFLKGHLESDLKMAHRYASARDLPGEIEAIELGDYGA